MGYYKFERFTVFLVEDNNYVRNSIEDVLRHVGFGRIMTADNGAEAIDYLKTMHANPQMAQSLGLDMVITDLVMAPINGLLLTRWLRNAKESPDRFIPIMMMSGAADKEYVNSARDLGATEFVAKPYSVDSIMTRVMEMIDYPRQFVTTHNYFGPDRRRRKEGPPKGEERRKSKDSDVNIVYSGDNIKKAQKDTAVWYFRLPNALKEKAGGLGSKGPGKLPADLLEKAEKELNRSQLDFTVWALKYLSQLSDLCTEALMKPGRRNLHFEKINLLAHELRGQGGTFGYPLISTIGKMLYDSTMEGCSESDTAVEIVKCHIDSMRAIIREKVRGDGGQLGKELLAGLKQAIDEKTKKTKVG